jgi:uncharacterized protein YbaR (Trm112 family)
MCDAPQFACPRCFERMRVSDETILHERRIGFICSHCEKEFTVENRMPDLMAKHFHALKQEIRRQG